MTSPPWSVYARSVPVLKNRRQSLAFMTGMGLKPQALKTHLKHVEKRPQNLDEWLVVDTDHNWACPLVLDLLDIDVDVRPINDIPSSYTTAFFAIAIPIIETVEAALVAAGLRFRAFGRTSFGCKGHFVLECPVAKQDEDLLRRLTMFKAVDCEGVRVRIEVRRRPEKAESLKTITLPGSTYRTKDEQGLDLIQWSPLSDFAEGAVMPRLDPQPYDKLRLGMYMAMMGLALLPQWERDNRHHCAFHLAGALAHELREGTFTEDECKAVMEFMIVEGRDEDGKDRRTCLDNAITAMENGRKVTGYTKLVSEGFISEAWKIAILRLRGGGDPDAIGRLFDIIGNVGKGIKKNNIYVDLSAGAARYVEMDQAGLRHRFKFSPEFPPTLDRKGKAVEAVEVVMHSPHIKRFAQAVSFPGIPFGVVYRYDHAVQEFIEVDPEHERILGEPLFLNVAAGFETKPYAEGDAPDDGIYREATKFWFRLRRHLTADDPEQADNLDQIIAHKLQRVRFKDPVGCALVGGQKIGKTFLFDHMLGALIGDELIKKSSTSELRSEHRFNGIERVLFYVVEECRFAGLPIETLQMLKDLMRNRRIHRNVKYGEIGEATNVQVPFFLSNELHPRLIFDGIPDRALVIIRGESQASLEMTANEWKAHQDLIHAECVEFKEALRREDIRRALLHYFLELALSNRIFSENESKVDPTDFEDNQSPVQAALISILREGYIMPLRRGERGPSIRDPFALETLAAGLRERLRDQRVSTFDTTPTRAAAAVAELFRENTRAWGVKRSKGTTRTKRDKVLKLIRYFSSGIDKGMYYFSLRRGSLLALLEEKTTVRIVPDYTLDADGELGEAPEPSKPDLARWYRYAAEQADGPGVRFGIV